MITVTLYSRTDCHLCEQAYADLLALQAEFPHQLTVIDVDEDEDLRKAYGFEVPVVQVGPYTLKAPFGRQELQITLAAAHDREQQLQGFNNAASLKVDNATWTKSDRFVHWLSHHYLAVFNLFVLVYFGLPVMAPIFMKVGLVTPAAMIYRAYSVMCHQLAFRSFFLFGEQPVYPREAAGVKSLRTYGEVTGLGEASTPEDLFAARQFVGSPQVGYKIALCERDISIWGGILLFGLLYAVSGRRLPGLPWYLWILIGLVPIGLDGFTQLLSQPPFSYWPYRESTPFLRVLTGGLFGFTSAWFSYPLVEISMAETRQIMARKRLRLQKAATTQAN